MARTNLMPKITAVTNSDSDSRSTKSKARDAIGSTVTTVPCDWPDDVLITLTCLASILTYTATGRPLGK